MAKRAAYRPRGKSIGCENKEEPKRGASVNDEEQQQPSMALVLDIFVDDGW